MKYIIFLAIFISFVCYSDNHNHDHDHDHHHDSKDKKEKKQSLKAHEHGVGNLNIVQEGKLLVFEFELPGFDIVGFEYKAKKKEDIKKIKKAINILSNYENMIQINNNAECKVDTSKANLLEDGSHAEFRSKYVFKCNYINKIEELKINYFKNFKNSEKLKVKIISEKKTGTLQLLSDNYEIKIIEYF